MIAALFIIKRVYRVEKLIIFAVAAPKK